MVQQLIGLIAGHLYKIWAATFRYHWHFESEKEAKCFFTRHFHGPIEPGWSHDNMIFSFFHQDELSLLPGFIGKGIYALVSPSKDGQIMASALSVFGMKFLPGSSNKSPIKALMSSLKIILKGHHYTIAVDGPRGPIYQVKPGILKLAEKSERPVVIIQARPKWFKMFHKAWNKAKLPLPFTRIDIIIKRWDPKEASLQDEMMRVKDMDPRQFPYSTRDQV